jgi:hypothetical protein
VQPNHDPAIGFVRRRGFRGYNPSLTYGYRPQGNPTFRRFTTGANMSLATDLSNETLTREIDVNLLSVEMQSQDVINFNVTPTYERLERNFEIIDGVILPSNTEYDFNRYRVGVTTRTAASWRCRPRPGE